MLTIKYQSNKDLILIFVKVSMIYQSIFRAEIRPLSTSIVLFADQSALLYSPFAKKATRLQIGRFGRRTKVPEVENGFKTQNNK